MKLYSGILLSALALLLVSCGETEQDGESGDIEGTEASQGGASIAAPGGIALLEGYEHVPLESVDGETGRFSKPGGATILYRIGWVAGNYTGSLAEERGLTPETEEMGDRTLLMVQDGGITFMTVMKDGGDSARWPANFQAPIVDPASVDEMRQMVKSYSP